WIMMNQRPAEVWQLVVGIAERISFRVVFKRVVRQHSFQVLQRNGAVEAKLAGGAIECGDGYRVIEYIMQPAETGRSGRDLQVRLEEPQIVTFARPEHHSMLAQAHRLGVAINSDMVNLE